MDTLFSMFTVMWSARVFFFLFVYKYCVHLDHASNQCTFAMPVPKCLCIGDYSDALGFTVQHAQCDSLNSHEK